VSGTIRIDSLARASGIKTLDAPSIEVMSRPIALIDGLDHRREPIVPVPIRPTPPARSAPARRSSSEKSRPSQSKLDTPSTATFPSASCRVASSLASAIIASGVGPPNTPSGASARSVTMQATSPRRVVVRAGWPTVRFPMSATMKTSHCGLDVVVGVQHHGG
jgi:hypothetical protein